MTGPEPGAADLAAGQLAGQMAALERAIGAANRPGKVIEYSPLYRTQTGVGCAMGFAHWDFN